MNLVALPLRLSTAVFAALLVTGAAWGQTAGDLFDVFGGIVRTAVIESARNEWSKVPQNEKSCVESRGYPINRLIESGVFPADARLQGIRAGCRAAVGDIGIALSSRPTFDCAKARRLTAQVMCRDQQGAAADWDLSAAYWARYFLLSPDSRQNFETSQSQWIDGLNQSCRMKPPTEQGSCVLNAYRARAAAYRQGLSGDALAESWLSPEQHAQIQNGLIARGLLSDTPDGEFGPNTRAAISSFQRQQGADETGYLTVGQRQELLGTAPAQQSGTSFGLTKEGPSFDCSKARNIDETTICSDVQLAELDLVANAGFEYVRSSRRDDFFMQNARELLRSRQACGSDKTCIRDRQLDAIRSFREFGAPVSSSVWVLSNSQMLLVANQRTRTFFYDRPNAELSQLGARAGMLAFRGQSDGQQYTGTAVVFERGCGEMRIGVSGPVLENSERVVLRGMRPACGGQPGGQVELDLALLKPGKQLAPAPVPSGPPRIAEQQTDRGASPVPPTVEPQPTSPSPTPSPTATQGGSAPTDKAPPVVNAPLQRPDCSTLPNSKPYFMNACTIRLLELTSHSEGLAELRRVAQEDYDALTAACTAESVVKVKQMAELASRKILGARSISELMDFMDAAKRECAQAATPIFKDSAR